ncbi:tetratricopeptide repeat protein [Puteibacter caeruleilacunae]|nr:tetratricopeptide repeat protein [Puteibacter caeruleilacunae]
MNKRKDQKTKLSVLDKVSAFVIKRSALLFYTGLCVTVVVSLLLFNFTVSIGGDDSEYIISAKKFLEGTKFPDWHGAFYPIFLSAFVGIFGLNVILFKFISMGLMVGHYILTFKTFHKRIPGVAFLALIAFLSFSSYLLYYASQTYSEALYMFLQASVFYLFYKREDKRSANEDFSWWMWGVFILCMFFLSITRNIGMGVVLAIGIYYLIEKQYKGAIIAVSGFTLSHVLLSVYKRVVWGVSGSGIAGQLENMTWKHFYLHDRGKEDFFGIMVRIWDNANLYLSKHFAKMIGMRGLEADKIKPFLTVLFVVLTIVSIVMICKRLKHLLFAILYLVILIGGTFVTQQKHWDQERLILIFVPLMVVVLASGLLQVYEQKPKLAPIFLTVCCVLFTSVIQQTIKRVDFKALNQGIHGDKYVGFTNDWKNYLNMCQWAGKNLPKESVIMCRKPNMAALYGKGNYKGLYRLPSTKADSVATYMADRGITHVIMGSLRRNPKVSDGRTITTIKVALGVYTSKYAFAFKPIHEIGESEKAYLFEIVRKDKYTDQERLTNIDVPILVNRSTNYFASKKGNYLYLTKRYDEALPYLNLSVAIKPDDNADLIKRGVCLLHTRQFSKAMKDFKKLVKKYPERGDIRYNLGVCQFYSNQKEEARKSLIMARQKGQKIHPELAKELNL